MKVKVVLFIFLFIFSTIPITSARGTHSYDFPNWVKKGAYVNYSIVGQLTLKYNGKYYFIWDFKGGYLKWEIVDVDGDIATLHIKLKCTYLNVGDNPSLYLPQGIIDMLEPTNKKGFVNYTEEKTVKVNYMKRELLSNGGYVNLWINPAADVNYGSVPPDIQSNPHAKPFLKYSPARYIPKYMIFPSNKSVTYNNYTFQDFFYVRVFGNSDESREKWLNLSNSGAYDVKVVNMENYSAGPLLVGWYDRDTGILIGGQWFDDVYVSVCGLYDTMLLKYHDSNIFTENSNPFGITLEGIIALSAVIGVGVAVWMWWKRKR